MKKIAFLFFAAIMIITLAACSAKHYNEQNISDLYDDEWIIGKSREEIELRYGEFRREYTLDSGEDVGAYYVNYENSGIDPSYIHDTYFIVFNEEDIAIEAYFRKTSKGG